MATTGKPQDLKDEDMVTIRRDKLEFFVEALGFKDASKAAKKRSDSNGDAKDPPSGDGDVNS